MTETVDPDKPRSDEPAARVRQALDDAAIGADITFTGLAALDGFGRVTVDDGTVGVPITMPIPGRDGRALVEREIRTAVLAVDGIHSVECRFVPEAPDTCDRVEFIPDVKNVVAVGSGKGGVGKSTVAVNLAVTLANAGAAVGLLDADVYGPNAPAMLGLTDQTPEATHEDSMVPREAHGVRMMSMGFIADEEDPVIWRGPLVDEFLKQLFDDVTWDELDYLIVDLPPGTGDAQLSLVQHLPVTGCVIVTTPQAVAVDDARRGLRGFARYDIPVLGIAENMAGFECPDCGAEHDVFDTGGAEQLGAEFDVPVLGRLPIDPAVGAQGDATDQPEPPGVSIPGLGRLQLPRTRAEREGSANRNPVAACGEGDTRQAVELLAARTAARISALAADD